MNDSPKRELKSVEVQDLTMTSRIEGDNYVIRTEYTISATWVRSVKAEQDANPRSN